MNLRNKVIEAAKIIKNAVVQERVEFAPNLFEIRDRYHLYPCYQNFTSKHAFDALLKQKDVKISDHDKVAAVTLIIYKKRLEAGNHMLLPDLCKTYKNKMIHIKDLTPEETSNIQSHYIKSKL